MTPEQHEIHMKLGETENFDFQQAPVPDLLRCYDCNGAASSAENPKRG